MITKVGRMVTYLQWHLPMKSRDHIITWFCEITWKTKIIMHPLPQYLTIKSGRVGYTVKSHGPLITWSCKVMWNIYLYYHNAMATRLGEVVTYYEKHLSLKSNNPSNTWSREVMWNHFISTTFESVASKPGGVVTYNKEFSSKKSQDLSPRSLERSSNTSNTLYFHYHNDYDHRTWQGGYIQWEAEKCGGEV